MLQSLQSDQSLSETWDMLGGVGCLCLGQGRGRAPESVFVGSILFSIHPIYLQDGSVSQLYGTFCI